MSDNPAQHADTVATATINGERYYPHYYSTYCVHGLHEQCRLTCKHCEQPCLCRCHQPRFEITPPDRLGDRFYVTCPRCQFPLTGRSYGPVVEVPPRPVTDEEFEQLPILVIPEQFDGSGDVT